MSRRAVVTGIGVVAPTGVGTDAHWAATRDGRCAIAPISGFDTDRLPVHVAGQVPDFNAEDFIDRRLMVQTDRWTWMALAAGQMALDDAGFDPGTQDPYSMCVMTASSSGGNEFGQKEIQNLWAQGPKFVGAYQSIAWFYAATTGQLSIKHGMKGHCGVFCSEGTGGLESLSQARKAIGRGFGSVLSGGTEAPVAPYAAVCQTTTRSYSAATDPSQAYRPFDAKANGYVTGEGGAIILVEELDEARTRGVPQVYGEIAGYAATHDAYHVTDPDPSGHQLARAITGALERAGVSAADVDVVFADAAGTIDGDLAEARALTEALGGRAKEVPVTAPKSTVGRLYAGGSSLDVATALLAMRDGVIPPTVNVDELADGCEINLVRATAQSADLETALLLARGSGGFNSALVLRSGASISG
ncbi:MAG: beta-ketoacyl synthase N-terminal-like domain-containing protein [Acidimicrobiia bacterium]